MIGEVKLLCLLCVVESCCERVKTIFESVRCYCRGDEGVQFVPLVDHTIFEERVAEGVLCALTQVVLLGVPPPGLQLDQRSVP